jgi:hypothetical protein
MEAIKLCVDEETERELVCPQCRKLNRINFPSLEMNEKRHLLVKCACQCTIPVLAERRVFYRKQTDLDGRYTNISNYSDKGRMKVVNLSMKGMGFIPIPPSLFSRDDRVLIHFTLDDRHQSKIELTAVVRNVMGNYVGCEFAAQHQSTNALGFYLMP